MRVKRSNGWPAWILASAVSLLVFAPGALHAEERPVEGKTAVILFAAEGVDPAQGSRLGDVLRRTMRVAYKAGLRLHEVANLDKKNDGMLIVEGEQHLVRATRFFTRGLENMQQPRRELQSYEEMERALHFYRSAYPYAQDDRLYTNIAFYAAALLQKLRGRDKREKAFKRCEAMGLAVELAGAPEMLDEVNKVYSECDWQIEDPENREIMVTTIPAGARVYVDGQYRGVTPVKLSNMRRGEHVFTFVREGYRRVSRILLIGQKFSETRELEMGLHLKAGVYRGIYKDLIPVVQGVAEDEQGTCGKVAQTLEVEALMMVLTVPDPATKGVKIYITDWRGPAHGIVRSEYAVSLGTPDAIEDAVVKILAGVYGTSPDDLPSLAERPPIYFKLEIPPFEVEEDF